MAGERDDSDPEVISEAIVHEDDAITEMARVLREELGDSLSEGTPTGDLKRAVLTILRVAGCAAAEESLS